jgi:hypothetical protein
LLSRVLGNQLLGQIIVEVARFHRANHTGTGFWVPDTGYWESTR